MKFVTFENEAGEQRAGWLLNETIFDIHLLSEGQLPNNLIDLITDYDCYKSFFDQNPLDNPFGKQSAFKYEDVKLLPPLPKPNSFRDFVAFETHVKNATNRSNSTVPDEWYELPIFYFSNANAMKGPNEAIKRPAKSSRLDFELEMACVIGKKGSNIKSHEAKSYIFGFTILNDWSARDLQMSEMKVLLGPAKGKDFATSIGPYIATIDEFEKYQFRNKYDLKMTAAINGEIVTEGNFKDIYHDFEDMIERASDDVTLYPGDLIGSGTVGYGCLLELGEDVHRWLEPGDEVELKITGLGSLKNKIV